MRIGKRKYKMNQTQLERMRTGKGFIAALDQSGGSTPKTLAVYGVSEQEYHNEAEMFAQVQQMRARIMTSPAFSGEYILGAILFAKTLEETVDGLLAADYLWERKQIVPFLKVDVGLAEEENGVQLMKANPELLALLEKARAKNIFGTKMRSLIKAANPVGIAKAVEQQFVLAKTILAQGLMPIVEPEVAIEISDKLVAEKILKEEIQKRLDELAPGEQVMLKLSLPSENNFYADVIADPRVLRVVALSGGYPQVEANEKLLLNQGMIASFSRALLENLTAQQTAAEFDQTLGNSVKAIYTASVH